MFSEFDMWIIPVNRSANWTMIVYYTVLTFSVYVLSKQVIDFKTRSIHYADSYVCPTNITWAEIAIRCDKIIPHPVQFPGM